MNEFEARILKAIHDTIRNTGSAASTLAIASRVYLSDRQTRRYLVRLEAQQRVRRVGQKSGWVLPGTATA